jgi:hypothetical protein
MHRSHHADAYVPLDVRNHSDHSGSDDRQRRAAYDFPQQMIGPFPAADAKRAKTYIESHRYQPPLRKSL